MPKQRVNTEEVSNLIFSQETREKKDGAEAKPKQKATNSERTPKKDNNESGKETRTRRVQVVIEPSTYEKINGLAWEKHISTNGAIVEAIEQYIARESKKK